MQRPERSGFSLVEISMAAPLVCLLAVLVGALVCGAARVLARTDGTGRQGALVGVERIRRELREARAVLYPAACSRDAAAGQLVLRTFDGDVVVYHLEGDRLVRSLLDGGDGRGRTVLAGLGRVGFRCLSGKRTVIRMGLAWGEKALLTSTAVLAAPRAEVEQEDKQ